MEDVLEEEDSQLSPYRTNSPALTVQGSELTTKINNMIESLTFEVNKGMMLEKKLLKSNEETKSKAKEIKNFIEIVEQQREELAKKSQLLDKLREENQMLRDN